MAEFTIRKEINHTIKAWRTVKPPVDVATLVLAAFLAADDHSLTKAEAVQWIYDHFDYYRGIGISVLGRLTVADNSWPMALGFHDFREDINRVFSDYAAALWSTSRFRSNTHVWRCDATSAAYKWRQACSSIDDTTAKPFRFLDLPAELRNTVYDLVFQYPSSVVCLGHWRSCRVREWRPDLPTGFDDWVRYRFYLPLVRRNHPFALLRVCRQIHKEASPSFLATNMLMFQDIYRFTGFQACVTSAEMQHITRIALAYCPSTQDMESALRWLQRLPKLTELLIHNNEGGKRSGFAGCRAPDRISCGRAANLLGKLQCFENINVQGDCPKLRAALARVAAKLRTSGENSKTTKKSHKVSKRTICKFCDSRMRQYLTRSGRVKYNCTGACPGRRMLR